MVEKDVGERGFAFGCVQCREVNACISKGLVGWGKHRERTRALKGFQEFSLNDGGYEGGVVARALSSPWNVVGCVRWHEHLVNDMDEAVAGNDVRQNDVRIVHHHAVANREGQRLSICSVGLHTIRDVGGRNLCAHNVVEKDVGECGFAFGRVQRSEVNTCICESLVGRCKDRERTVARKGGKQVCLDNGRNQGIVNPGGLCCGWNVCGWHQHGVDDVDNAV